MPKLSDHSISILKDACSIHEFTEIEQARMEVLAEQINEILKASKARAEDKGSQR